MNQLQSTEFIELFAAISKAQAEIRVAQKDSSNPFFKSSYANLQSIIEASRPALCKYGLSVMQKMESGEEGDFLVTILAHSSGQSIESRMRINPVKTDIQSLGSYITYLRRYSYAALVGVYDGMEDDDGNDAVQTQSSYKTATEDQIRIIRKYISQQPELEQAILYQYGVKYLAHIRDADAVKLIAQLSK